MHTQEITWYSRAFIFNYDIFDTRLLPSKMLWFLLVIYKSSSWLSWPLWNICDMTTNMHSSFDHNLLIFLFTAPEKATHQQIHTYHVSYTKISYTSGGLGGWVEFIQDIGFGHDTQSIVLCLVFLMLLFVFHFVFFCTLYKLFGGFLLPSAYFWLHKHVKFTEWKYLNCSNKWNHNW